jgi:hypothetical protein
MLGLLLLLLGLLLLLPKVLRELRQSVHQGLSRVVHQALQQAEQRVFVWCTCRLTRALLCPVMPGC